MGSEHREAARISEEVTRWQNYPYFCGTGVEVGAEGRGTFTRPAYSNLVQSIGVSIRLGPAPIE